MPGNNNDIEKRVWDAADKLWANSDLRPPEFSTPVPGLNFLRDADHKFTQAKAELAEQANAGSGRAGLGRSITNPNGCSICPSRPDSPNLQ